MTSQHTSDSPPIIRTARTANWEQIVEESQRILAEESRSFHGASKFLPSDRRDDAAVVYAFCRSADDLADETDADVESRDELDELAEELRREKAPRPIVAGFLNVADRRGLDPDWALELVRGVRSDLDTVRMRTDRELIRYCYRVAGTVGLMMSPVLGVEDTRARPHAVDLGVGMQLTNICRDVAEDAAVGRTYLPEQRLREAGTTSEELLADEADREAVSAVVRDLLELADEYYQSGRAGMRYIPRRSRLAIMVASRVYRAIGLKLRDRGCDPMQGRAVVGPLSKLWWIGSAFGAFLNPFGKGVGVSHDRRLHRALSDMPGTNPPVGELDAA
jgi:phytoene synthase